MLAKTVGMSHKLCKFCGYVVHSPTNIPTKSSRSWAVFSTRKNFKSQCSSLCDCHRIFKIEAVPGGVRRCQAVSGCAVNVLVLISLTHTSTFIIYAREMQKFVQVLVLAACLLLVSAAKRDVECKKLTVFAAKALETSRSDVKCTKLRSKKRFVLCSRKSSSAEALKIMCTKDGWKTLITPNEFDVTQNTVEELQGIELSPDGRTFATSSSEGKVYLVGSRDGKIKHKVDLGYSVTAKAIAWSPNGQFVAVGDRNDFLTIIDAESGQIVDTKEFSDYVNGVDYSPDGKYIVVGTEDYEVSVLDATTLEVVWTREPATDYVHEVRYSHDGTKICAASEDYYVYILDAKTGGLLTEYELNEYAFDCSWSRNDQFVFASDEDYSVHKFNARTGQLVWENDQFSDEYQYVSQVSPNDKYVVTGDESGEVYLLDARTGEFLYQFPDRDDYVNDVRFTPDGRNVYGSDEDGYIFIYPLPEEFV
eukprot:m.351893 g.351893  ORF g.351893 m.351893 type:complete len:477 (+) comp16391_c0_seq1:169-1599(+)